MKWNPNGVFILMWPSARPTAGPTAGAFDGLAEMAQVGPQKLSSVCDVMQSRRVCSRRIFQYLA